MQTEFTAEQLTEPRLAAANAIIRNCVHCGFCTATCPTYLLTGDELDSPRGRIWLMKDMLEAGGAPSPAAVHHIDRCLGCLSCMTTCPSDVNYRRLVDEARGHIARHHRRPLGERLVRGLLSGVLTRPWVFGLAARLGRLARPLAGVLPGKLAVMLENLPARRAAGVAISAGIYPGAGQRRARVALHSGCVQPVLRPAIDRAAVRLLNRHGVDVVVAATGICCGALDHHMGHEARAVALARANIEAWEGVMAGGLDAIVITASGCGTVIKHYDDLFANDPEWAARGRAISGLVRDVSEFLSGFPLERPVFSARVAVAYHSACSLQHGQGVRAAPRDLLAAAGFEVREISEGHICCGSAGTYSVLQPEMAQALKARKQAAIAKTGAAVVASGNIGCLEHLDSAALPTVHVVELLDWATGGPKPAGLN